MHYLTVIRGTKWILKRQGNDSSSHFHGEKKKENFPGFEGIYLGTKATSSVPPPYSHRSWKTFSGSVSTLGFLATFRATIDQPQRNKKAFSMAIMLTDHLLIMRVPLFRRMYDRYIYRYEKTFWSRFIDKSPIVSQSSL